MGTSGISKSDRLLRRAEEYVSDYWLPVNRELLEKIRHGVRHGQYDTNRVLLRDELCSDLGLFFGCIRELHEILADERHLLTQESDLTTFVETVDIEFLRLAIEQVAETPSVHIVSEGDEQQLARLLEAVISATTAGVIAPAFGENSGRAVSLAALRQLGYALVAWNYPNIYQEALDTISTDPPSSLDDEIAVRLGFSPLMLAARLAKSWGLSQDLVEAALIPSVPLYEEAHIVSATHETLSMICRISESLARAQFDSLYPTARADWASAVALIEEHIGPDGVESIRVQCATACRYVVTTCPDIFRPGLLLDEELLTKSLSIGAASLQPRNPYLAQCETPLRTQLEYLYRTLLRPSKPSEKALRYLMQEVISYGHFSGGCVFTVDPTSCRLMPQLEVGSIDLRTGEPVPYLNDTIDDDPVPIAFLATKGCEPVIMESVRESVGSIACAFGRSQRLGVLYLEMPLAPLRSQHDQNIIHFKALTHALVDCLGL